VKWWYITQGWRTYGDRGWLYTEVITSMHPVEWLIDWRRRARENGWRQESYIHFALEISEEQAQAWDGEVG
jgi:hypothetical protein